MKVKLSKPLPQIGRVIPAGVIVSDAPECLMAKLVRQGRAVWVHDDPVAVEETPQPPVPAKPRGRKKVTSDG